RAGVSPRVHQAGRPGVTPEGLARGDRTPARGGLPADSLWRQLNLAEDQIDEPIEDVLLIGDMVVERHRLDSKLLSEPAHGERLDPLGVGQNQRGAEDSL